MMKTSCFTSIIVGFVSLLVLGESAGADLVNGDFTYGISGWDTAGLAPVVWSEDDQAALFQPDGTTANSTLSQEDITVNSEFPWLSFDVFMLTEGGETDVFTASLGGDELYELLSSDPIVGGVIPVTLNVSDFIGAGPVKLEFNLAHVYTDDSTTTVLLDNVALVPVPGALILGSIGLSLAGCWLGKRRTL